MNIIITGGSKGIGRAIAEKFAANGYSLFLCAREKEALTAAKEELQRKYPFIEVNTRSCDVAVKDEVTAFGEWALAKGRQIDVLVNNAGAFTPGNIFEEDENALETLMKTNVYSAYHLSRAIIPSMINRKKGHIFNICSIASVAAYPGGSSYGVTKYALAGLSANLREEMKPYHIKVTSVFPGAVYTPSWQTSGIDPARFMKVDDIAEMIFASSQLSPQACVEEILLRPQTGDV